MRSAPLVRSLVNLHKGKCALEQDQQGCYIRFCTSAAVSGVATSFFMATEGSLRDGEFQHLEAEQISNSRFEEGLSQTCRLFLCQDIKKVQEGFKDDAAASANQHLIVLDLRADSADPQSVTAQRSFLKLGEGDAVQVVKQMVQCGSTLRSIEAMYGTMPNPRGTSRAIEGSGEPDSGDCVICLSKPREVVILHCRHVCLCSACAKITSSTWSFQCPVCRGRVAAMVALEDHQPDGPAPNSPWPGG